MKKKNGKKYFLQIKILKNWKKKKVKETNYFFEIRAKKVCSKMDQQQNEQHQKDGLPYCGVCFCKIIFR